MGVMKMLMFVGPLFGPVVSPELFRMRTERFVAEFVAQYQKLKVELVFGGRPARNW